MQRHPFKPKITHIDFQRVIAGQDVHTNVPLHFVNEEKSAAVKAGGIAEHHVTEIEVTCLPKNLPEFIEVDMAGVEMGQTLHLSDLTLPAGVSSPASTPPSHTTATHPLFTPTTSASLAIIP